MIKDNGGLHSGDQWILRAYMSLKDNEQERLIF